MNYLKNFIKTLIWPIIFMLSQFIINVIFTMIFNNQKLLHLKQLYPNLNDNELNQRLLELINTNDYQLELTNYISSKGLIIAIITLIIFIPILLKVYKQHKTKYNEKLEPKNTLITIILGISFALIYNIIIYNINSIYNFTNIFNNSNTNMIIIFITSCIVGPLLEEFLFRGIVYNKLKQFNPTMRSIILTCLIFGLFHSNIVQIVYGFIFSFILIYVYEKYKNLKYPIIMHISANTIVFLFTFIIDNIILNQIILIISLLSLSYIYLKIIKKDVYNLK